MTKIIYEKQLDYLTSFRKVPDSLLYEMECFAVEKRIPILNWKSAEFLEQIVLVQKPNRVLEIGMAIGYSSIRIASILQPQASLDTIEKSKNNIDFANDYIKRAHLSSAITILEGEALEIMPNLKKKYDLIFLDADKEDYEKLFTCSLLLLKKGGVFFVDNLLWHGYVAAKSVPASYLKSTKIIRDFNKKFLGTSELQSVILPIGDGIGIGVKIK